MFRFAILLCALLLGCSGDPAGAQPTSVVDDGSTASADATASAGKDSE